jgi:hypothetical protein
MRFYFKIEKCVVVVKSDSAYLTIMMQHAICINLSRTGIQSDFSFKFEFNIDAWRSGGNVGVDLQVGLVKGTKSTSPCPDRGHFLN